MLLTSCKLLACCRAEPMMLLRRERCLEWPKRSLIGQGKGCHVYLVIQGMDQDTNLPVASHTQAACTTEVPIGVGGKLDGIGSHIHIEHRRREGDAQKPCRLSLPIKHPHGEDIWSETVWGERKGCRQLTITGLLVCNKH